MTTPEKNDFVMQMKEAGMNTIARNAIINYGIKSWDELVERSETNLWQAPMIGTATLNHILHVINPTRPELAHSRLLKTDSEKGDEYRWAEVAASDQYNALMRDIGETLRQALHDRDRFQREAEYWREECINLTAEALR